MDVKPHAGHLAATAGPHAALLFALGAAALLVISITLVAQAGAPPTASPTSPDNRGASSVYAKLPLSFVPNRGQSDRSVRFYAQSSGASFYFTKRKAVIALTKGKKGAALHLRFLGANPSAHLAATKRAAGRVNYLTGNDPSRYQTNLPTYRKLVYKDLWPGIDLAFRGDGGKLKYEFRLAPGADPADIRLAYAGAESLRTSKAGALLVGTPVGTLSDAPPRSHQRVGRHTSLVRSRYAVRGRSYGFEVGAYDRRKPLVIDPDLVYSTYLGGTGSSQFDRIQPGDVAADQAGGAYVVGVTRSTDFPTTAGAFDTTFNSGFFDVFVTKLDPTGATLDYSTYLGGSADDLGFGIAVDGAGEAYITGGTSSSDFPTTPLAFDRTPNGGYDAFVTKLNADGTGLAYSTFLGGSSGSIGGEAGNAVEIDASGGTYVTGTTESTNFPITPGATDTTYGGGRDAFVTKLNGAGTALDYSAYLGGSTSDRGAAIAVDAAGSSYVTGDTSSTDFPTTERAFDTTCNGCSATCLGCPFNFTSDAFVTKVNAAGSSLVYSTYLGRTSGEGIAVDGTGSAYVTGSARFDFPTTPGAFDRGHSGSDEDAFVTKLDPTGGALAYSTRLGGYSDDHANDVAVDDHGNAYVTGFTGSPNLPTTAGAFDTTYDAQGDGFVTKLNETGSRVLYSAFLGGSLSDEAFGIGLDPAGNAYVEGSTQSPNFPTTAGAFDRTSNGSYDAFIAKFDVPPPESYPHNVGAFPISVSFVPAFKPCETASADASHGTPLDFPSCSNPVPRSSLVTLGASSISFARIFACAANSGAAFCNPSAGSLPKPDVRFAASIRDVRCASTLPSDHAGCSEPNADYDPDGSPGPYTDAGAGKLGAQPPCFPGASSRNTCMAGADISLDAQLPGASVHGAPTQFEGNGLRVTDSSLGTATLVDIAFPIPLDCLPTTDPTQGSTCGVNTTATALAPGVYRAGDTGTWQIGELELKDSGPYGGWRDGDEQVFAVQGIFLP